MNWKILLDAFALMLVFEGLFPFISPAKYRQLLLLVLTQSASRMRITGLVLMIAGLILAIVVHSL